MASAIPIETPDCFGHFANAFRVLEGDDEGCLLDFLVFSASANKASVVSRIRVRREFLPAIRDSISMTLTEVSRDTPCPTGVN